MTALGTNASATGGFTSIQTAYLLICNTHTAHVMKLNTFQKHVCQHCKGLEKKLASYFFLKRYNISTKTSEWS